MKAIKLFLSHHPLVIILLSLPLTLAGELLHLPAQAFFIILGLAFFLLPV